MNSQSLVDFCEYLSHSGARNMLTVPGKQIIRSMPYGYGKMKCVYPCFVRQINCLKVPFGQVSDFVVYLQNGESREGNHSLLRSRFVSSGSFFNYKRRDETINLRPETIPPFEGDLLMACDNQVSAWPRCEITDNARFDVYCRLHQNSISKVELSRVRFLPISATPELQASNARHRRA
ncbi:MAG: hypothetical protein V7641_4818 [Blastocatellia bacterium]